MFLTCAPPMAGIWRNFWCISAKNRDISENSGRFWDLARSHATTHWIYVHLPPLKYRGRQSRVKHPTTNFAGNNFKLKKTLLTPLGIARGRPVDCRDPRDVWNTLRRILRSITSRWKGYLGVGSTSSWGPGGGDVSTIFEVQEQGADPPVFKVLEEEDNSRVVCFREGCMSKWYTSLCYRSVCVLTTASSSSDRRMSFSTVSAFFCIWAISKAKLLVFILAEGGGHRLNHRKQ